MTKYVPRIGDKAYSVEWTQETSDGPERDHYGPFRERARIFRNLKVAESYAQEMLPHACFGVDIFPVEFTAYDEEDAALYPTLGTWEEVGEALLHLDNPDSEYE